MNESNQNELSLIDFLAIDIIDKMLLRDRTSVANFSEDDIYALEVTFGDYLREKLKQLNGQETQDLVKEGVAITGNVKLEESDAELVIFKEVWKRLREKHMLRVVK